MTQTPHHAQPVIEPMIDGVMPLPSPEAARRIGRASGLIAGAAGLALVAGGCSTEAVTPAPTDTRPNITTIADGTEPDSYINVSGISADVEYAIRAERIGDYVETQDPTRADDSKPSVPIFKVVMGKDGNLKVVDQTDGSVAQLHQEPLVAAVAQRQELLSGLLGSGAVHELRMRIAKPDPTGYDLSTPFYLPNDKGDALRPGKVGARDNIYEVLDPEAPETTHNVAIMLGHEEIHAALRQGEQENSFTLEQQERLRQACLQIRRTASEQMASKSAEYVSVLNEAAGYMPETGDAFRRVADSLERGIYYQLPLPEDQSRLTINGCSMPPPLWMVRNVLQAEGIESRELSTGGNLPKGTIDKLFDTVDMWQTSLKESTVYGALSESTYFTIPDATSRMGHPHDDSDELLTSTLNVALTNSAEMAQQLRNASPEDRQAIDAIVRLGLEKMRSTFAKQTGLMRWLDECEARYRKDFGLAA